MFVICPSCAARFDLDPALLGPRGRVVRCSQCAANWHQAPETESPRPRGTEVPRRKRSAVPPLIGGIALALALLAAVGYFARSQIAGGVPAAARLYALIGVPIEAPGARLALENITSVRRLVEGKRLLIISGKVKNLADEVRPVPRLRASLTDDAGLELVAWDFSAAAASLAPGARTSFETSTEDPPRTGASLAIRFVAAD